MAGKQAVVIIHGIGEQKPMDTLRSFVDAVWTTDKEIHLNPNVDSIWSKPDGLSKSFELRRLTTSQNKNRVRTDFYEFYWAHMMDGTTYGHVTAWAKTLLLRRPSTVPKQLQPVYWLLVAILAISVVVAIVIGLQASHEKAEGPRLVSWVVGLFVMPAIGYVVLKCVGDAARYLYIAPENIKSRHEIRQAGVDLLMELHRPERGYDRIVLVGHSLGSVIGYDILTHAWPEFHLQHNQATPDLSPPPVDLPPTLDELERVASSNDQPIEEVQKLQRQYHRELRERGCGWRVTDFVTVGSPLAHSAILLAKDIEDLKRKQREREFPTCLPALETSQGKSRFSFFVGSKAKAAYRAPHHAAVFAATRWTNLYFPSHTILLGDLIGGPLREVMGEGVRDVQVETQGLITHSRYWTQTSADAAEAHILEIRRAVNLLDQ